MSDTQYNPSFLQSLVGYLVLGVVILVVIFGLAALG